MVIKLSGVLPKESEILHAPFYAEEIRDGDAVKAKIRFGKTWEDVRVWRYSPFGIEFVISGSGMGNLGKGTSISLRLQLGSDSLEYDGLIVNEIMQDAGRILAGVRTFRPKASPQTIEDRREHKRWTVSSDFMPTGMAPNPVRFNDFIHFRVDNISGGGLRIITSMRNKLVGIGQRLDVTISLPLVGSVQASLIIRHLDTTEIDGKEFLVLGTQIVGTDAVLKASLAEYLLNFAEGISLVALKEDGFPIKASRWLDFSYAKSEEEFREVLNLRFESYQKANKLNAGVRPEDMTDEFDARARILIAKHKGRVIGSLRAMFHEEGDKTEHDQYLQFPPNFPKKSQYIEATRVCTDPNFRGSDILYVLLAHLLLTAIKSSRRYIVGCAAGSLIKFYEKCGYQVAKGIPPFRIEALNNVEHRLIYMDTHQVALGKGISTDAWIQLYGDVVDFMLEQELIQPSQTDLIWLNMRKSISKIKNWFSYPNKT